MRKLIALSFIMVASGALAEQPLSLRTALDVALKNNYEVRIASNQAEAARVGNTWGAAGALPSAGVSVRDRQSTLDVNQRFSNGTEIARTGTGSNSLSGDLMVDYTLFNGFRIRATRERLTALQRSGEQQLLVQLQHTMANVIVRYFDVVRQQRYYQALERSREFSAQKLSIIQQRVNVGLANNADLYESRIDLNSAEQHLAEQQLSIKKSSVDLAVQLGLSPDTVFTLTDSITIDSSFGQEAIIKELERNPELAVAAAAVKVTECAITEIRSQRLPALRLDGGYTYGSTRNEAGFSLLNEFNGPSVGATLVVPVFNGGAVRTQEKTMALQRENAKLEEALTRQRIIAQAVTYYEAYRTAIDQLSRQEESYTLSSQVMDIQLLRFSNGQSTILDLRSAQSVFEQSAASLYNARYVAKTAETELLRLISRLQ